LALRQAGAFAQVRPQEPQFSASSSVFAQPPAQLFQAAPILAQAAAHLAGPSVQ
jgi:hypothetical protein